MDERAFEGTLVLEQLARIDAVDAFMDAVDSDDFARAAELMRSAGVDPDTMSIVLKQMADPDDQH